MNIQKVLIKISLFRMTTTFVIVGKIMLKYVIDANLSENCAIVLDTYM